MMAGLEQPSNGEARLMPGFTVGLLVQEPELDESKTVLGNVEEGVAETKALLERYNEIAEKMATDYSDELLEEMGRLQEQLDHRGGWDLDSQLEQAMDALRCPPPDADVSVLSGGERRRVALCKLLLSQPDLLLLDEPTNHLDAESVQWLEQHLEKYPGTVVAVTHDRYFLDNVAQWILELDRGHAYPYEGNYSTYLETKAARLKVEGQKDAKRRKRLEDELEWVRSSPRARQAKSRARLQRYEEMAAEADTHRKLDFEEIQIPPGPRLGSLVVEADDLAKGFGDRVLIEGLSFSLPPQRPRRRHRPERGRQDHAVQDDRRRREAGLRAPSGSATPSRSPTWTSCGPGSTRTRPSGRPSPTARPPSGWATSRSPAGPTWPRSASRARTSRSRPGSCPAASAAGSTWRSP